MTKDTKIRLLVFLLSLAGVLAYVLAGQLIFGKKGVSGEKESVRTGLIQYSETGADKDLLLLSPRGKEFNLRDMLFVGNHTVVLFVFSRPCIPCNNNLTFWKKAAAASSEKNRFFGIIVTSVQQMTEFAKIADFNFPLYCPADGEAFLRVFNIRGFQAHTVLVQNRKIVFAKAGLLDPDDYFKIRKYLSDQAAKKAAGT